MSGVTGLTGGLSPEGVTYVTVITISQSEASIQMS